MRIEEPIIHSKKIRKFKNLKRTMYILLILIIIGVIIFILWYVFRNKSQPSTPIPYNNCPLIPFDYIKVNNVCNCRNIPKKYPLIPKKYTIPPTISLNLPTKFTPKNNNLKILNSTEIPIDIYLTNIPNNLEVYNNQNVKKQVVLEMPICLCPRESILISDINEASGVGWAVPNGASMDNNYKISIMEWTINSNMVDYDISAVNGINGHIKAAYFKNNTELLSDSIKWIFSDLTTYQNENKSCYKVVYNSKIHGQGIVDINDCSVDKTNSSVLGVITALSEQGKYCQNKSCPLNIENILSKEDPLDNQEAKDVYKNDCCMAGCPTTTINQHFCRKWYKQKELDNTSYCNWLQKKTGNNNRMSNSYCWAYDEFKCTDNNCGWDNKAGLAKCIDQYDQTDASNRCSCLEHGSVCINCNCVDPAIIKDCPATSVPLNCSLLPAKMDTTKCLPIKSNPISTTYGCMNNNDINPNYRLDTNSGTVIFEITYLLPSLYVPLT